DRIDHGPGALVVVALEGFAPALFRRELDPRSGDWSIHPASIAPGEPAATKRAPRDHAESLIPHHVEEFVFRVAIEKIVERLQAHKRLPAVRPGKGDRFLQLTAGIVAGADVTDLAARHEPIEGGERLFQPGPG